MQQIVMFNDVHAALPHALHADQLIRLTAPQQPIDTLAQAAEYLAQTQVHADRVAFSPQTPALLWVAAIIRWPKARFMLFEAKHAPDHWLDVLSGERWPQHLVMTAVADVANVDDAPVDTAISQPTTTQVTDQAEQPAASDVQAPTQPSATDLPASAQPDVQPNVSVVAPKNSPSIATPAATPILTPASESEREVLLTDSKLLFEIYRFASYGEHQSENKAKVDEYLREAALRNSRSAGMTKRALTSQKQGQKAYALTIELEQRFKQHGQSAEFMQWFEQTKAQQTSPRLIQHLDIRLNKAVQFHNKHKVRTRNAQQPPQIHAPDVQHQPHPNSLRHLPAHDHWHILIDETGEDFEHPDQLRMSDRALGKWVALALPVGVVTLPPLRADFHAVDEDSTVVDAAVQTVLDHAVGVFGMTCKDPLSGRTPRWFSGIHRLIRIIMRLLPMPTAQANRVEIFIENRGVFSTQSDLLAVQQLLESELISLDPVRFGQLSLSLQFIGKAGHANNGYVDALAYTWGAADQRRLKMCHFLGHCFLRPSDDMIERTYAALDADKPLSPADWYQLTSIMADEPADNLLQGALSQLGESLQRQPALWQQYLTEVQYHLSHKQYTSATLAATLGWLQQYQPKDSYFSPRLRLQWIIAQLAADNHVGHLDRDLASEAWQLAKQLIDEHAPESCHAHLRLAVAATNTFEFERAYEMGLYWLKQPIGMVGRLNHAKLLSSLGQHSAFLHQSTQAMRYFDQSLAQFDLLSDRQEAERESKQTQIYRLICMTDQPEVSSAELQTALEQFLGQPLLEAVEQMATRYDDRFAHHMLVRVLLHRPEFKAARLAYLEQRQAWQTDQGHPWGLINAWRGWLLWSAGWSDEARCYFEQAIRDCVAGGQTLSWIGAVIATLTERLGVGIIEQPLDVSVLREPLPNAPHEALLALQQCSGTDDQVLLRHVAACLPFNFR